MFPAGRVLSPLQASVYASSLLRAPRSGLPGFGSSSPLLVRPTGKPRSAQHRHRKGREEAQGRVPVEARVLSCSLWSLSFPFPAHPAGLQRFPHSSVVVLIREGPPEPLSRATAGW